MKESADRREKSRYLPRNLCRGIYQKSEFLQAVLCRFKRDSFYAQHGAISWLIPSRRWLGFSETQDLYCRRRNEEEKRISHHRDYE